MSLCKLLSGMKPSTLEAELSQATKGLFISLKQWIEYELEEEYDSISIK